MKTAKKYIFLLVMGCLVWVTAVPAFAQIILQTNLLQNSNLENSTNNWNIWGGNYTMEAIEIAPYQWQFNQYLNLGSNNMTTESISQNVYLGQYFPDTLDLTFDYQITSEEYGCQYDKAFVKIYRTDSIFGMYPINSQEFTLDTINLCVSNNTSGWATRTYDLGSPAMQAILGNDWYFGTNISVAIEVYTDFSNASTLSVDNIELWAPVTP